MVFICDNVLFLLSGHDIDDICDYIWAIKTHRKSYITYITDAKGHEIQEFVEILTDLWVGGLTRQNLNFFEAQGHYEVISIPKLT